MFIYNDLYNVGRTLWRNTSAPYPEEVGRDGGDGHQNPGRFNLLNFEGVVPGGS